jgi:myo-inositol-1(or 4)-monophosphatase
LPGPEPAPSDAEADLALLTDAAEGAAEIALRHFGTRLKQWEKAGGQGPVTAADMEVNAYLHERLGAARPSYGWLSEEGEAIADHARLSAPATFVVDPIDGTRAFIAGQKGFAHALAVVVEGSPVAAVVHLPALGLTYRAIAGRGAWLNDEPLAVSRRCALTGARVLATRAMLDPRHWPGGLPPVERHFRPALAWRLALVGEGRFDAMLTLRDAWDWDIAAAALIAAEAGARVTDRHGAPLRFNTAAAHNPGVIAAPAALHADLLQARGVETAAPPVPPAGDAR